MRNDKTISVLYVFDFLVILPVEIANLPEIAQRYQLNLTIHRPLPEDKNYRLYSDDIQYLRGSTEVEIEYADRAVANNISLVVNKWLDAIKISEEENKTIFGKFSGYVLKNSSFIFITCFLFTSFIYDPNVYKNFFSPYRYLLLILLVTLILGMAGEKFSDIYRECISKITLANRFEITNGDDKFNRKAETVRKKSKTIINLMVTTMFLTIPIGIFCNYISNILFK